MSQASSCFSILANKYSIFSLSRAIAVLLLITFLLLSFTPHLFAATYTIYPDRLSFESALNGAPLATQNFQSYPATTVSFRGVEFLPGVSSTSNMTQIAIWGSLGNNFLFGWDEYPPYTRTTGTAYYDISFTKNYNAISFNIVRWDPNAPGPAIADVSFRDGTHVLIQFFQTGASEEYNPVFFGIISDSFIDRIRWNEGPEIGGQGNEEVGLDDFAVAVANTIPAAQLPRTGQTTCYDTAGAVVPCAGTRQDGDIRAGVPWPDLRFTDNGIGTVTDNLTGLMWTKDANAPGPALCSPATTKTWNGALNYVTCLNTNAYLGYTDWRLPNINEIESLIDPERSAPALPFSHPFTSVKTAVADQYWSSTTLAGNTGTAWTILLNKGSTGSPSKSWSLYVWPVRSGQSGFIQLHRTGQTTSYATGDDGNLQKGVPWPNPRFTNHGNRTSTDNLTGLMWTNNMNLPGGPKTWQQALDYVAGMNSGTYPNFGYKDWRLPNVKELLSVIDYGKHNPALPSSYPFQGFTYDLSERYWSSTTNASNSSEAWAVRVLFGDPVYVSKAFSGYYYVWPVRGGQIAGNGIGECAYIYSTDFNGANDFRSLLDENSCSMTLIHTNNVANVDFSIFKLIIIGNDTQYSWTDVSIINKINNSGKPILGIGEGGYNFFGQLNLSIGSPWGWHGTGVYNGIYAVNPSHTIFQSPNPIPIQPDNSVISLYSSPSNHVGIYLPTPPPDIMLLGREIGDAYHYPFVLEENRYLLWGFTGSPSFMTPVGKSLFQNAVSYFNEISNLHSFSGTVTENGLPLAGVTIALDSGLGDLPVTTTTAPDGTYSFTDLPDGNYTITPSLSGYSFTPASSPVTLTGVDKTGVDFAATPANHSPILDSIGSKSINEAALLSFTVNGSDPDGNSLTFSASQLPSGATFDQATRVFSWTPGYDQSGLYSVAFTVSDGSLTTSETVAITVNNVNRAPILDPIGPQSVYLGTFLTFTIRGSDSDGDNLTYSVANLPAGTVFNQFTQTFSWTPLFVQPGVYKVTFAVNDGSLTDSEDVDITVLDVARPTLNEIGKKYVCVDAELKFTVSGSDPNGDVLTFNHTELPLGAGFDALNHAFSWRPSPTQEGIYKVTFTVSNGIMTDSEEFEIEVLKNVCAWEKVSGPWGSDFDGNFISITSHPSNPDIIFIGSSKRGLFKSIDGGKTWIEKNTGLPKIILSEDYWPITKIVIAHSNPNILYLGTSLYESGDIYKSIDGGDTWQEINGERDWVGKPQIQGSVFDIAIDPRNPEVVYTGVAGQGVFKTINGGTSWENIYISTSTTVGEVERTQYFHIIRISPSEPNTLYISGFTSSESPLFLLDEQIGFPGLYAMHLRKSRDGGQTWEILDTNAESLLNVDLLSDLEINPSTGTIYGSKIMYTLPGFGLPYGSNGILKSIDGGYSWQSINNASPYNFAAIKIMAMTIDKNIPERLVASTISDGIFLSIDGGKSWELLSGLPSNIYIGNIEIVGDKLFVLTSNGIYIGALFNNTQAGNNITVSSNNEITVNFPNVSSSGYTSITRSFVCPPPPDGFWVNGSPVSYNIDTTASYAPPATVCITYNPEDFNDPNTIRLFHYKDNTYIDITTSNDTTNHAICGQVNSFSLFAIFDADMIKPTILASISSPTNSTGWHNADVTVTFSCFDAESGIATCPAPVTVTTEGAGQVVTGITTDKVGNRASTSITINLDKTPPTITPSLSSPPNHADWHNTDVTVFFACNDALSNIASCTPPVVVSTEGVGQVIGGTAIDVAGNSASASVTVNLDKTPPALIMPVLNSSYAYRQNLTLNFDAQDALSNIETMSSTLNGVPVNSGDVVLLNLVGQNIFTLTASDRAGNVSTESLSFDVINTPPTAEVGADLSLKCLEMSCPVILDGSGSTDPNSTPGTQDDIISYEWYENYGEPGQVHLASAKSISLDFPLGDHSISLIVTDTVGATGKDTLKVSVNPAQLSLLEISKAEVEWDKDGIKPNRVKIHGRVAMPAGKDFYLVNPVGTVSVDISSMADVINQSMTFQGKGENGSKWEYKATPQNSGITQYMINWDGAKFDYNKEIRIKSNHLGQGNTTLEIDRKDVIEPITITVQDVIIGIDSAGAVTMEPPTLSVDIDDDGEIEVILPFALTQNTVFSVTQGTTSYQIKVGDYYSAAVGKFEMMGQLKADNLNGSFRPATLELGITFGDQRFPGMVHIIESDWKLLKAGEWKYKR